MDELTSALDPVAAANAMDLLDIYLSVRDTTLWLIASELGLAARRVERLMVVDDGRIFEDAPREQLLLAPATQVAKAPCVHRNWLELPCLRPDSSLYSAERA